MLAAESKIALPVNGVLMLMEHYHALIKFRIVKAAQEARQLMIILQVDCILTLT